MDKPKEEKRESQVSKWIKVNSGDCGILTSTIDNLEARLTPVLREEPPPTDKTEPEEEFLVGVAVDLRAINCKIVRAIEKLSEIIDRLEL